MANDPRFQKVDAMVLGPAVGTPAHATPRADQERTTRGAKVPYRVCTDAGAAVAGSANTPKPRRNDRKQLPVKVEFCGTALEGVIVDGKAYVAMKPIVEGMGLTWEPQFSKLRADEVLSSVVTEIVMTATDGKRYKMLCLPEDFLQGWLFTVKPGKIKPELREKLVKYKRECYRVLHHAFTQGVAETNLRVMAVESKRAAGRLMTDVTKETLMLAGKEPKPHHFSNEHRLINWVLTGNFSGIEESALSGPQADLMAALRRRNSVLIGMGLAYNLRKNDLVVFVANWSAAQPPLALAA